MNSELPGPAGVRCTVAIPVFNRQELVRRALDSALAQTVPGLEVLVVDNCSTDATWEVLQTYAGDPRLRLVRNERNVGLFGNFNRCLSLARGEYLRFLCSDDRLAPDCLAAEVALMDANPDAAMLTTRARHVDPAGRVVRIFAGEMPPAVYAGQPAIFSTLWLQVYYGKNPLNCPSGVLIRRSFARLAGDWNVQMTLGGDLEYYFRLLRHGNLVVMDSIGCDMLIHRHQTSIEIGYTGVAVTELYQLIAENADVLEEFHSVGRIQRQAVTALYWQELQGRSVGVRPERSFGEQRRKAPGYGTVSALLGLVGMALRRAETKWKRRFPLPVTPLRPLAIPSPSHASA